MVQFDVDAHTSESAVHGIAFVVLVKSDLPDALGTRRAIALPTTCLRRKLRHWHCWADAVDAGQARPGSSS
jgi:hypothetical protein